MIKLSPSSLNLFLECPRCFWIYINKEIKRPGPPVASVTNGLDRSIKKYFEEMRLKKTLPEFLQRSIPGKLMENFPKRGWLEYTDTKLDAKLGGFLDECIQFEDGRYAVLDHKTRGSAPESVHKAYQLQMDAYTFLLEANNYLTRKTAYLVYYIPKRIIKESDFEFEIVIKEIKTDPSRAKEVFNNALAALKDRIPNIQKECSFCQWTATLNIQ